jgi:membrane protein DedA with SNARE-associated domain
MLRLNPLKRLPLLVQAGALAILGVAAAFAVGERSVGVLVGDAVAVMLATMIGAYVLRFAAESRQSYLDNAERYPWHRRARRRQR